MPTVAAGRYGCHVGMYFKLAPGVRVRVTTRGVRTSLGPRAARVHVGGGYRPGVSTGAGPVTLYQSVGGSRRRRSPGGSGHGGRAGASATVAARQRQAAAAARSSEAERLAAAIASLQSLHRDPVEPVSHPVAPDEPPVDAAAVRERHEKSALRGVPFWKRSDRRAAREAARASAEQEIDQLTSERDGRRRDAQALLDRRWAELVANEPDVVQATLAEAFEEGELHSSPLAVEGGEVSLAVFVPGEDVVPERKPGTTPAGKPTIQKMTVTEQADLYTAAVCGHVVAAVREAFAVAPGLGLARAVAVRVSVADAYGRRGLECLLAVTLARSALDGIDWSSAGAYDVLRQAGPDLTVNLTGRARHLSPLDLAHEPDLAALLQAVDLDEAAEATGGPPAG